MNKSFQRPDFPRRATALGSSLGVVGLGSLAALAPMRSARAADYKALVCVFLYGGNDGSNTIVPTDATRHQQYSAVRGAMALPRGSLLALAGSDFGLHPSLSALAPIWAEGQLDRIRALRNSPYEYNLHLDTDTRVLTPEFPELFRLLDDIDIGMAICQPDVSKCAQMTGLPMFNVGFILFRKSPGVLALLEAWENLARENF